MSHLNYNHLYYFWMTQKKGSVTQAAEALFLTPQTVTGQIKLLEQRLLKLRPTRDCETLQDRASEVTDEVTVAHDEAQMRFDMIEAKNFQDRMLRILRHRREIQENQ